MSRRVTGVRAKLWPSHRHFTLRQDRLDAELSSIRAGLQQLAEQLAEQQRLALAAQAELRTRLRRTQALTARAYEALQDWPQQLDRARAGDAYERAYTEPEPLVTVAISTYHSPDTLCERALASVRSQTYGRWEAIVVGDHCTDDTEARLRALGDDRIRFHNLAVRENDPDDPWERWAVKGSVPRATAVGLAGGSWIAPLSHDDEWDEDHLQTLLDAAREQRAEIAYSRIRIASELGGELGAWPPRLGQFAWQSSIFNGALRFLRYDRNCALASEPNDWNLARRAWEAGVRFAFVARETSTLWHSGYATEVAQQLAELGQPPEAAAYP